MRLNIIAPLSVVSVGLILVVVGLSSHIAVNKEYHLTVKDVLNGEPYDWLTGRGHKTVIVTGFALRKKAEPIDVQSDGKEGRTTSRRVFFPVTVPGETRAILVTVPHDSQHFDDTLLLSDTADQVLTFTGVLLPTPKTTNGGPIENMFGNANVTFPSGYCLYVGEKGGMSQPKGFAIAGGIFVLCGLGLLAALVLLRAPESGTAKPVAKSSTSRVGAPSPWAEIAGELPAGETPAEAATNPFDAMAAIVKENEGTPETPPNAAPAGDEKTVEGTDKPAPPPTKPAEGEDRRDA